MGERVLSFPSDVLNRAAVLDAAELSTRAEKDDRVPFAISSEEPVLRVYPKLGRCYEVLEHDAAAFNAGELEARGLPLRVTESLEKHDPAIIVGRLEGFRVGADRKLRAMARFSRSDKGQEIRRDVEDGIRSDVSIGYAVQDGYLADEKHEGLPLVRVTKWRAVEATLVAAPADVTVGAGRAADPAAGTGGARTRHTQGDTMDDTEEKGGTAVAVAATKAEKQRAGDIAAMCQKYGLAERAGEYIGSELTVDQVARKILEERATSPDGQPQNGKGVGVELSPKEKQQYSLRRAILASAEGKRSGFEFEVSDTISKRLGLETTGFFAPTNLEVLTPQQRATLVVGTGSLGGSAVFTEAGSFIELLRKRMYVRQAGAVLLSGLQGPVSFPRQATAGTLYWESETGTVTQSNPTLNTVSLSPKRATASVPYGIQLLRQAILDVEMWVRNDLSAIMALGIDLAAINGAGSNNEPTGILNTSGIGSVTMGANGAVPTFAKLVDLETEISADNADAAGMKYMTTTQQRGFLKQTQQFSGTNGVPIWTGGANGEINGYGAFATNQVPSNLTKGTSTTICHAIIFGNFPELMIGEWGAMEFIADPYTQARAGIINLTVHAFVDVAVRHAESFAAIKDAL